MLIKQELTIQTNVDLTTVPSRRWRNILMVKKLSGMDTNCITGGEAATLHHSARATLGLGSIATHQVF